MSYTRRHSTNVCPGNRVRYNLTHAALADEGGDIVVAESGADSEGHESFWICCRGSAAL